MRVLDAQEQILALFASGKSWSTLKYELGGILDAVWLEAYEEGKQKRK